MAPAAIETITVPETPSEQLKLHVTDPAVGDYKELSPTRFSRDDEVTGKAGFAPSKYPNYLPTWNPDEHYPPLVPFEHYEHGKDADPTYPELLPKDGSVQRVDLTPSIGSEVSGIQLSKLTSAGKDQLARFVAERKVVAFRKQDFADLSIQEALDFAGYFGRHHIHPTSGAPPGYPEVHVVHRAADDRTAESFFKTHTNSVAWHSDVSYELQPPGTTFLYILDKPETGGDTLFTDAVEAYNRLSPGFQQRLHGLKATHSGIEQVNSSVARGSIKRRDPVLNAHPLVRTHPATGEKSLYVNPQFTRDIIGLKKEESDAILGFLYSHLAQGADFQARVKWEEGTVVVWDNRVTQHTALVDWKDGNRRHLARITPQAERPYETPFEG